MFSNSKPKGSSITLIARNTRITGEVHFTGMLNVEGSIAGDIVADSNAKSEVAVLEHGSVEGQIRAPRIIINGHVRGDIFAEDQVFIAAKAVIEGSVHYRLIEMEKGAQISGNIVHQPAADAKPRVNAHTTEAVA